MADKFDLGRVVITRNAANVLPAGAVQAALARHAVGDWGDVCPEDAAANDESLRARQGMHSAYEADGTRFWIITEADRSVTTVLLPEDY